MSGPFAEDVRGTHAAWPRGRAPYAGAVSVPEVQVPEQVYVDASRAYYEGNGGYAAGEIEELIRRHPGPGFLAAVESAYRAGYQAGTDRPRWGPVPDRVEVSYTQGVTDEVKAAVLESAAEAYRAEYGKPDPTS